MILRSTFVRARWLLLLLPLFALASTMQVGCTGGSDRRDDFSHEDLKSDPPARAGNTPGKTARPSGGQYGGYDDGYGYDDDGYGYGYE